MSLEQKLAGAVREAKGDPELQEALEGFRPLLGKLRGMAEVELAAFFDGVTTAYEEDGDAGLANMAFDARRKRQRELTGEAAHEALRVEARAELLRQVFAVDVRERALDLGLVGGLVVGCVEGQLLPRT